MFSFYGNSVRTHKLRGSVKGYKYLCYVLQCQVQRILSDHYIASVYEIVVGS